MKNSKYFPKTPVGPQKNGSKVDPRPGPPSFQKEEIEILGQKIAEIVSKSPEKAALILSQWINRKSKK